MEYRVKPILIMGNYPMEVNSLIHYSEDSSCFDKAEGSKTNGRLLSEEIRKAAGN
jgi:hypothetical protein